MQKIRNVDQICVGNTEEKRPLEIHTLRSLDNIKMKPKGMGSEGKHSFHMPHDRLAVSPSKHGNKHSSSI